MVFSYAYVFLYPLYTCQQPSISFVLKALCFFCFFYQCCWMTKRYIYICSASYLTTWEQPGFEYWQQNKNAHILKDQFALIFNNFATQVFETKRWIILYISLVLKWKIWIIVGNVYILTKVIFLPRVQLWIHCNPDRNEAITEHLCPFP